MTLPLWSLLPVLKLGANLPGEQGELAQIQKMHFENGHLANEPSPGSNALFLL